MATVSKRIFNPKSVHSKTENISLWDKYIAYTAGEQPLKIYWYLKAIILIPCAFMVISIYAMAMMTTHYIWFVGLSMILFFANVITHIAGAKPTIYIPLYHGTIVILILIPLITYLLIM